jgi:hypothetical protein
MQLIDAEGRHLPTNVRWTGVRTRVTLRPGQSGYADVTAWQMPGPSDRGAPCDPPAAGVLVTPPDETTHLKLTGARRVCGNGLLEAGAVVPTPPEPMEPIR